MIELADMPTLSDALKVADVDILANEIIALHAGKQKEMGKKKLKKARRKISRTIEEMREIELAAPEAGNEGILLPLLRCSYKGGKAGGKFDLEISPELVMAAELADAGGELRDFEFGAKVRLAGYSFAWESWKNVLAYRIWMGDASCDESGDGASGEPSTFVQRSKGLVLSRRERYQFLAEIVWEMTFHGWSEERHEAKLASECAELIKRRTEIEEGKGECLSLESFKARFGLLDANDVGLEASTDDYSSEHKRIMDDRANLINDWCRRDFLERANCLFNMLQKGYGITEAQEAD